MRVRRLLALSACWLLAASCAAPTVERRPNFVLIYIDDMGWRDLGVQGSTFYETPNIDQLAAEGMRFTRAYANAPNCAPSRAALLSGQYAPRTGVYTVASAERGQAENRALVPVANRTDLDLDVETLAETLARVGYTSGHIGKWHLGGPGSLPEDQGFAWSIASDARGSPPGYFFPYGEGDRALPGLDTGDPGEYLTDRLIDESIRFIEREQDGPFFLQLSHYSVHTPLEAKPELVARYEGKPPSDGHGHATYAAMVHSVDEGVGRLLEALDDLGLMENTVVIFTSDNGGFGPATAMTPLRGSKGMLYEGGIRVPLLVRWPGDVAPGRESGVPVLGIDLYPTLAEIAGAPLPEAHLLDGKSLVPVLTETSSLPSRDLFWHFPAYLGADASVSGPWRTTPVSALQRGRFKLLHFFEGSRWELYDLEADESETNDLAEEMPHVTRELRDALEQWWAETGAFIPTEPNHLYRPNG